MSQISQLTEAEIEERFHVVGSRPVAFMLAGFVKDRVPFDIHFGGGHNGFVTILLAVEPDDNQLILDYSGSAENNRQFLQSDYAMVVGRPGGVHVQFAIERPREIKFEGSPAFAVGLPARIIRLQRRDAFRIETPRIKPLAFRGSAGGLEVLSCTVHDISVGGIGLTMPVLPPEVAVGLALDRCQVQLPPDGYELRFAATVRNLIETEDRAGNRHWRIGLEFNDLSQGDQARIHRYIAHIERERRELS